MSTEQTNISQAARDAAAAIVAGLVPPGYRTDSATSIVEQRVLDAIDAATAELRKENESLRELWTEMRGVLTQSRDANCLMSYGKAQHDAVEAANRVLNKMPDRNTIDDASSAEWRAETFRQQLAAKDREIAELREKLAEAEDLMSNADEREKDLYWRKQYDEACQQWGKRYEEWEAETAQLRAEVERLNGIIKGSFPATAILHELLDQAGCVSVRKDDLAQLRAQLAEAQERIEQLSAPRSVVVDKRIVALEAELAKAQEDLKQFAEAADEVLSSYIVSKRVEAGHPCPENMVRCKALRAAIDAARGGAR